MGNWKIENKPTVRTNTPGASRLFLFNPLTAERVLRRMLLIPGTGNGERGTGNRERESGN